MIRIIVITLKTKFMGQKESNVSLIEIRMNEFL